MLLCNKKGYLFFFGLICAVPASYAMQQKEKNPFFNLEDAALTAVMQVAPVIKDDKILSKLEQAKKGSVDLLPQRFAEVVWTNVAWHAIRSVGLEQKKINLLTCEQMVGFDQTLLLKLQKEYYTEFKIKDDKFTDEEVGVRNKKAIVEAIDTLSNFLKSAVGSVMLGDKSVTVFKTDNTNKNALVKNMDDMYQSEGCGICEKKGADVFWFSPYSRCAHKSCYELIKGVEQKLDQVMLKLFNGDNGEINFAHVAVIEAIREACGCPILEYVQKNSLNTFEKLYNTVGDKALEKYYVKQK